MPSRRAFLKQSAALIAGVTPVFATPAAAESARRRLPAPPRTFLDLSRPPVRVVVETAPADRELQRTAPSRWEDGDIIVTLTPDAGAVRVGLTSPTTPIKRIRMRWNARLDGVRAVLGDAWERAYGDLEWRGFVPDRVMPWYVAMSDGRATHAYGMRTGARALCFWQADLEGLTLVADVRSGGVGVELGARALDVCDVVSREGRDGESAFAAVHAFCKMMCAGARLPAQPIYGHNDWYWAYGKNSAATVLVDAERIVELAPAGANRPFAVIDDGWQPERGQAKTGVGTWDHGNENFGDMATLAGGIRRAGARPGVWIRPLLAPADAPASWRLSRDRATLDPTIAEVRQKVATDVGRVRRWGYELIKHDYSSYDIFGRWGSTMGDAITRDGWRFAEGAARTTAEVIGDLYRTIREAAGDALVIGCNTISHLAAGVFDICRIGDDTSGREWARTRKMGVNTLAFRGAQHGAFYVADADCVGITSQIPWAENRLWLDLLSRSGTMLFVSIAPDALTDAVRRDVRAALARAAEPQPLGEPLDWQQTVWPARWRLMGRDVEFDWMA